MAGKRKGENKGISRVSASQSVSDSHSYITLHLPPPFFFSFFNHHHCRAAAAAADIFLRRHWIETKLPLIIASDDKKNKIQMPRNRIRNDSAFPPFPPENCYCYIESLYKFQLGSSESHSAKNPRPDKNKNKKKKSIRYID